MHIQRPFVRLSPFLRMTDGGGEGGSAAGKSAADDKGGDAKDKGEGGDDDGKKSDDDPLREPGKRALERERQRADDAEKDKAQLAARLKELEDAGLTDEQKVKRDLAEAKAAAEKATARLLRYEVAEAKDLPAGWANRLQGTTREELERDAEDLKAQLGAAGQPRLKPDPSQGRGGGGDDGKKKGSVSAGADLHAELHSKK